MRSTAASHVVSLEEYLKFEAPDGTKDELIEGEIVISLSGSAAHAFVIKRLVRLGAVKLRFAPAPGEPARRS